MTALMGTTLTADMLRIYKGFERGIARYKADACDAAKSKARNNYQVVSMDPGCRCERTDAREWQCDINFAYTRKKGK
jgi:hypothetical protein